MDGNKVVPSRRVSDDPVHTNRDVPSAGRAARSLAPKPSGSHISPAVRAALADQSPEIARHVREVAGQE